MFCPSCGLEERQANQFCRACGMDLRHVRTALEKPDAVTDSAVSAREEIGRAVAAKIREVESAHDLKKIAEDVLPQIEKFLESPAEKRLRRVRAGMVTASAGLGATILLFLISLADKDAFFLPAFGIVAFFVGLGIIINGLLFTVPPKIVADNSLEAQHQREMDKMGLEIAANAGWLNAPLKNAAINQPEIREPRESDESLNSLEAPASEIRLPKEAIPPFSSVTEQTTRHLEEKQPVPRN